MSLKRIIPLLITCLPLAYAPAQDNPGAYSRVHPQSDEERLAETINAQDLNRHLSILASDEMEGRETGEPGQKKAAAYIAEIFKGLGLPAIGDDNGYFQHYSYISEYWTEIRMEVNGQPVKHLTDFYSFPAQNADRDWIEYDEVVFLGYGIDDSRYNDYKHAPDVKGKAILIYTGEPLSKDSISTVTGKRGPSEWSTDISRKLKAARAHGASTVFIIDNDFKQHVRAARRTIIGTGMNMGWGENPEENYANSCFITSDMAKDIVGNQFKRLAKASTRLLEKGKLKPVALPAKIRILQKKKVRQLLGENVLGYVEGTDPKLKDEVVVLSAHYDHIGKQGDEIYNGADDNGTGSSAALEICQALVEAKRNGMGPRRSVLVLLVSGEEKGLLGSQYYVAHPVFPLSNTVADVNVDMIGRVDNKHADNPNYIYVIGADRLSSELHEINEKANSTYTHLELDYTYNAEDDPNRYYYRSDHYNFAVNGIPAIFYFSGTHADYHRPTDTIEKINFEKMTKISKLIFHTVWTLSTQDRRIVVDKLKAP